MVRLVGTDTVQARQLDFVTAARALGAGPLRLVRRHVLPHAVPLVVYASGYAGVLISSEAILTYAGAGLQRPVESWGIRLQQAQERVTQAPHLLVFPSLFLLGAVGSLVLLGRAVGRTADPLS